jgi:hypothetical protein
VTFPKIAVWFCFLWLPQEAIAQVNPTNWPIPGTPKGGLSTQLLQSRTYARSIENQLDNIEKRYPDLKTQVFLSRCAWLASPFASGCQAIEDDIVKKMGDEGRVFLARLDKKTFEETKKLVPAFNREEAVDFLQLTHRRAKGEIEVEMVRANLLWQHKPYQKSPEKEYSDGYGTSVKYTANRDIAVKFNVPMSWKMEKSPRKELMVFRNCYGHGNVWMTVTVRPTVDDYGKEISSELAFSNYNHAGLKAIYEGMGITLTSFTKTKVNKMPALLFTRKQPYEQLGTKALRAAEVVRVFNNDYMIAFQINTLGPPEGSKAEDRIKVYEALFKNIAGSIVIRSTQGGR